MDQDQAYLEEINYRLQVITLDWHNINKVKVGDQTTLTTILQKHESVFKDELGLVRGASAKIQLKPEVVPKFCKARPIVTVCFERPTLRP